VQGSSKVTNESEYKIFSWEYDDGAWTLSEICVFAKTVDEAREIVLEWDNTDFIKKVISEDPHITHECMIVIPGHN